MKRFIFTILLLSPCLFIKAQQPPCDCLGIATPQVGEPQDKTQPHRPNQDEIESRKIAYLSSAIPLTPAEAARFWPVYNEWNTKMENNMKKRHDALREIRQLGKNKNADEKAYMQQTKVLIAGASEEARIISEAHQAYVSILGEVRTAKLYSAEDQFRGMLIRELRQQNEKK